MLRWTGLLPDGYEVVPETLLPPGQSDVFQLKCRGRWVQRRSSSLQMQTANAIKNALRPGIGKNIGKLEPEASEE